MVENKISNILIISIVDRNPNSDRLYSFLGTECNLKILKLTRTQAKVFYSYLHPHDCDNYDRVLLDIPFRLVYPHAKKLRKIKKLVFIEEDTCQNYIRSSRWFGKYVEFYKSLPNARVLVTSEFVKEEFKKKGIDAINVSKAFDEFIIVNKKIPRKIKFGFVGRIKSNVYAERKIALNKIAKLIPIETLRAKPGEEYNLLLNKITYFISADFGLGEYMVKNFEALAAGCLLCAVYIPSEFSYLGFKDMENVVLYSSAEELLEKINYIESNVDLKAEIIKNGLLLAQNFTFERHAKKLHQALSVDISDIREHDSKFKIFLRFIGVS